MPQLESSADVQYQHQLPTVSFREIRDDPSLLAPAGVHSLRHYGYNDFSDFTRPEHYIRYIEPIETELAVQVEYDMDEQDQAWLEAINAERRKDQSGAISYEVFEVIMDKLEKEWFNLIKRIPQPASHMPVEDSKCAVCDDGEGENSNAIVFCDGCNLAVHQDCYGVPYIPEGQWLCRKCTVSPENPVSCLVCPNEGGAFKQTTTGHWAHLLCSIWIPELMLGNAIYMEPIDGVEAIPKNRWKLICSLCREKMGACVQCDNRNCFTAFHVTCARQMGYLSPMKSAHNDGTLKAYCDKHLPDDMRKDTFDDEFGSDDSGTPLPKKQRAAAVIKAAVTTKTARAHAKSYRPGPPVVPHLIVQMLLDYVSKLQIRKRAGFVEKLCRYWSLKREARRGAPLLKRLHLEPWTASNAGRQQTEAEKALKLSFLRLLRNDLEKVRMLAELVRKREREKLRQAQVIKDMVDGFIFPGYEQLRLTLEKISAMDRNELFLNPVNRFEVPDYFQVIKEPMSWMQMDDKLEKNLYRTTEDFKRDVHLVLDNAILYNKPETQFNKVAKRIQANVQPLLDELSTLGSHSMMMPPGDGLDISSVPAEAIGDLEPSLLLLQSALHTSTVDTELDNLRSVFAFEMAKPRPPTPPPPPPPTPPKRPTNAELRERRAARAAAAAAVAKPPVVPRATRANIQANVAFAQEAGFAGSSDTEAHSRQTSGASRSRSGRSRLAPPTEQPSSALTSPGPESSTSARGKRSRMPTTTSAVTPSEAETSSTAPRPRPRLQTGVVAIETIPLISDKERRKRELELDLVTEDIGAADHFKRFNVGWVLPAGTKRKRAERPDLLGVPRGRSGTASTSPLVPAVALPPSPEKAGPPQPSSPLSAISSDNLTPPGSEADATEAPMFNVTPAEDEGQAQAGPGPSTARNRKRKPKGYPATSGRKRRRTDKKDEQAELGEDVEMAEAAEEEEPGVAHVSEEDDLSPPPPDSRAGETTPKAATPSSAPLTPIEYTPVKRVTRRRGRTGGNDEAAAAERTERGDREAEQAVSNAPTPVASAVPQRISRTGRKSGVAIAVPAPALAEQEAASGQAESSAISSIASSPVKRNSRSSRKSAAALKEEKAVQVEQEEEIMHDDQGVEEAASDIASPPKSSPVKRGSRSNRKSKADTAGPSRPMEEEDDDDAMGEIRADSVAPTEATEPKDEEDDPFPEGTLVWAKVPGYPYFPAEIVDPEDEDLELSEAVFEGQPAEDAERHWLIRFFDPTNSFAWVSQAKMDMLGESDELDGAYLALKERGRGGIFGRSKYSGIHRFKTQLSKAFRDARAQMVESGEET